MDCAKSMQTTTSAAAMALSTREFGDIYSQSGGAASLYPRSPKLPAARRKGWEVRPPQGSAILHLPPAILVSAARRLQLVRNEPFPRRDAGRFYQPVKAPGQQHDGSQGN